MNYKNLFRSGLLVLSMTLAVSCSKDDDGAVAEESYDTTVSVTDAPIDNAEVKGAFVTITSIKVNGKALQGFQKTTVDLLALQNGSVKTLGNLDLEAGATSSIEVVLDHAMDAEGNSPGSYILTTSDEIKALAASSGSIVLNDMAEIEPRDGNELILDFDLRKMIVANAEAAGEYSLVSGADLSNSIRAVNKNQAGTIKGNITDSGNAAAKVVVYAYKKGTFSEAETAESNGVRFKNAVSSSVAAEADGSYELHFLEEGDYELHYASYSEDASGNAQFEGMLNVESSLGLDLSGITLDANTTTNVNVLVTGIF